MQAMQERGVEHTHDRAAGGELATPELAAIQQPIRTTRSEHIDTLANPLTARQAITYRGVDATDTASATTPQPADQASSDPFGILRQGPWADAPLARALAAATKSPSRAPGTSWGTLPCPTRRVHQLCRGVPVVLPGQRR